MRARPPRTAVLPVTILAIATACALPWPSPEVVANREFERACQTDVLPLFAEYCVSCHDSEKRKGGIDFTVLDGARAILDRKRLLAKAIARLEAGTMPPRGKPAPDDAGRAQALASLRRAFRYELPESLARPGRTALRRLNRYEYDRTVKDLLGVDYDSKRTFPSDPGGYGFDVIGDVQSMPPMLVEKYFDAAREIVDRTFADEKLKSTLLATGGDAAGDSPRARGILNHYIRLAFRRPPAPADVASRLALFEAERGRGASFEDALRPAFVSILLAPRFLFRVEDSTAHRSGDVVELDDYEIASRLSYGLWGTMPDAALFAAAAAGHLRDGAARTLQIRRMLADARSRSLADTFGAQWLRYGEILDRAVDFRRFPKFNDGLRRALYEESARFFDDMVRNDRSVLEWIDCGETYLNEALADHYGIPGVKGSDLRRVATNTRRRGGLFGMGSVLAVTSYPLRTSPVLRGKYILETLFHDPPPPPPPGVPALPKDDIQKDLATPRAQLERHRADAACASCHSKIDPPGLALEHFDATGAWRDTFQSLDIDDVTTDADGHEIRGIEGLKDYVMARKETFVRTFAEKLFTFLVGRAPEGQDDALLSRAVSECAASGWRFQSLLMPLLGSKPFLYRETAGAVDH
jgi:hypothetical protein